MENDKYMADDIRERLKQLEQENQQLRNKLNRLETTLTETTGQKQEYNNTSEEQENNAVNRRKFLKTLAGGAAGLSMLGMVSGFEIRSPNNFSYYNNGNNRFNVDPQGNVSANSIDLGEDAVSNLAGNNLTIDNNGNLNAAGGTDTRVDVENTDGSPLVQNASAIQAGTDLDFTDDGDGTATLDYVGSGGSSSSSSPVYIDGDTSYEHIKVSAGEVFDETHSAFDLTEGGTWRNKLIDITADGAGMALKVLGYDNWTIENIAVVGVHDNHNVDGHFWVRAGGDGGTGNESATMRNIWVGHGGGGGYYGDPNNNDKPVIFVDKNHIGTLEINGVYVAHGPNNGIYGSSPGVSDGNGGVVNIRNSYAERCAVAGFRLGTDGSTFDNCVAISNYAEGFRADEGATMDAVRCTGAFNEDAQFLSRDGTTLNLTDCRYAGINPTGGNATVNGTPTETPKMSPPSGCPRTAAEAITGMAFEGWNV